MTRQLLTRILLSLFVFIAPLANSADHGVILLYHHVSKTTPTSTSVTPEQFWQHLNYLKNNNFQVLPLNELLQPALKGNSLPENAVAITFDDAYLSVFTEAAPKLQQLGWPFTVFLASQPIDSNLEGYMTWQQARELIKMGADIGAHSHSHAYLARLIPDETNEQHQQRLQQEVDINLQRIKQELRITVSSFAYPFGEYDESIKQLLQQRSLYGLAQQSGAVGKTTDPLQIPRFPMATGFANMERFKTAVNSLPLPVVRENHSENSYTFTLAESGIKKIACYAANGKILHIERIAADVYRVDLPATRPGRNKINCTAPSAEKPHSFYWHSFLWLGQTDRFS